MSYHLRESGGFENHARHKAGVIVGKGQWPWVG